MPHTIIDTCTGCSACERRCPTAAIHGVKKDKYFIDHDLCIDCGACGAVCPDDAILNTFGELCAQLKPAERPKAYVELDKCTGCVYCVNSCPFDCITMENAPRSLNGMFGRQHGGIGATVAVVEMRKCTGCTLCEIDCPYDAIHVWKQNDPRAKDVERRAKEAFAAAPPVPVPAKTEAA